jgi:Uma2 family endonuclease
VDYLALVGRSHIGFPKRPTVTVYELVESEYQMHQFRGNDRIISQTFSGLHLIAEQIFQAGQ